MIKNRKVFNMLVKQLSNEMGNFYFYLKVANHYEAQNWLGFAKYYRDAASDEKGHADKIREYMYKKQFVFDEGMPTKRDFQSGDDIEIANAALSIEEATTQEWYDIYEEAKGKYTTTMQNGKATAIEETACEPSVLQTIATEFIKIQDAEIEEAQNFIAMLKMANDMYIVDRNLRGD